MIERLKDKLKRLRLAWRQQRMNHYALLSQTRGITSVHAEPLIVSLTSYGKRLDSVHLPIECIMRGTMKPQRIILWIEEKDKIHPLNSALKNQMKRGLEIVYVPPMRSYCKLIPALQRHPEATLITIDDDLLYPPTLIEDLLHVHRLYPQDVCANMVNQMTYTANGTLTSLREWDYIPYIIGIDETEGEEELNGRFFEGFGGVLYPPHCFTEEVLHQEVFTRLCPTADDVWFNAMVRLAGRKVRLANRHHYDYLACVIPDNQDMALYHINNATDSLNDKQLATVWREYNLLKENQFTHSDR